MAENGAPKTTLGQKLLLGLFGVLLFIVALAFLEGALALFSMGEDALYEDPWVGFAPGQDLFERSEAASGEAIYRTRRAKLSFFNDESFAAEKPEGGYRIFALGGSTTYGRPYDARVAFPRWLELYLRSAEPGRPWEVVNAGGISYASYRIALLEREVLRYEPDLLVLYTGHNEFLEERTYGEIRELDPAWRRLQAWLGDFRFYALARRGWLRLRGEGEERSTLPSEVTARLDGWRGLELYERDDELRRSIVAHFADNLRRIAALARRERVELVVVRPISNIKDFSPFKSEHAPGLGETEREEFETHLERGRAQLDTGRAAAALEHFERARAISPEYAEVHFRLGRALFELGDFTAAKTAFEHARDLDVAPLRAPSEILAELDRAIAENDLPAIDLSAKVEAESRERHGHGIPGDEYLQDHVHPTIEAHSLIAEELLGYLVESGVVEPSGNWSAERRREIYEEHLAGLDPVYYARRDLNLAKVLGWAGKLEEAEGPLERAAAVLKDEPEVHLNLGIVYDRTGRSRRALAKLERAIDLAPDMPEPHFNLGVAHARLGQLDQAAAALGEAIRLRPDYAEAYFNLGVIERRRGNRDAALRAFRRVSEFRPGDPEVERQIELAERGEPVEGVADTAVSEIAASEIAAALELARAGRLGEARSELEGIAERHPENAEAHYNLGVVLSNMGDSAGAVAAWERAVELAPEDPRPRNNLAIRYAQQGSLTEARELLERSVELDPGNAEAAFNLGVVYDQMGESAEAIRWIERSVELDPENPRFNFALGMIYRALGREEQARPHLEKAAAAGFRPPPPTR